jgi:hypothetical protein
MLPTFSMMEETDVAQEEILKEIELAPSAMEEVSPQIMPIMLTPDSVEAPKSAEALLYIKGLQRYFASNEAQCEHLAQMLAQVEANIINEEQEAASRYERARKVQPTLSSFFSRVERQ